MMRLAATVLLLLVVLLPPCFVSGLVTSSSSSSSSYRTTSTSTSLSAVSKTRQSIIDGAEWGSLKDHLNIRDGGGTICGRMTVVAGTNDNQRVVGIQVSNDNDNAIPLSTDCSIHHDSMAIIPKGITDDAAIFTLIASLAPIHCALPKATGIGGSQSDFVTTNGRVIVVGGSEYAVFVARGLAAMDTSVSIVSTGNPKIDDYRVESLDPAVGDMEVAFSAHVGEFDSLVDTLSDEANLAESNINDDIDGFDRYSGVLQLLKARHKCSRYVSTMTASQRIIRDRGVFFGPGQVKDHVQSMSKRYDQAYPIVPPEGFGATVQTLLNDGITFTWKYDGNTILRAWSIDKFWELTKWPRDNSGGSNIRFGFPVVDDLDMLMMDMDDDDDDEDEEIEAINKAAAAAKGTLNPFITEIDGVSTFSRQVLNNDDDKDCVLFLSATYCRTCKVLSPAYTRFARLNQADDLLFARADTTSKAGKELSKLLAVNAVPTFVLFRKGERFGKPLSINKLPSKKLELALSFLTSGSEWDGTAIDTAKEKRRR